MLLSDLKDKVFQSIDALLNKRGFALVDLIVQRIKGKIKVQAIIFSKSGLSIDECSVIHKILVPYLEELLETDQLYVEVSSPGLERNIKYQRELNLYQNRRVKILLEGVSEWKTGYLKDVGFQSLILETAQGDFIMEKAKIVKAKLSDVKEQA